ADRSRGVGRPGVRAVRPGGALGTIPSGGPGRRRPARAGAGCARRPGRPAAVARGVSVVFLNPVGALGGGERSLIDLLAVLRSARPDWPLHLIAGTDGPLLGAAAALGATAEVVPMPAALAALGDSGLSW